MPWVHAFCLDIEMGSMLPLILAPLHQDGSPNWQVITRTVTLTPTLALHRTAHHTCRRSQRDPKVRSEIRKSAA